MPNRSNAHIVYVLNRRVTHTNYIAYIASMSKLLLNGFKVATTFLV